MLIHHGLEFHVSRPSRDRYRFDDWLFSLRGNVVLSNIRAARLFAQKMNQQRDVVNTPEQAVQASHINAMGMIHELSHAMLRQYRREQNPTLLADILAELRETVGIEEVEETLETFAEVFPTVAVYRGQETVERYLEGSTEELTNREVVLEEMILLWIANANPAFSPYQELFDDTALEQHSAYPQLISGARRNADDKAERDPEKRNIFEMLLAPSRMHPNSLEAQLAFIRGTWGSLLGDELNRLLISIDLIREEGRAFLPQGGPSPLGGFGGFGGQIDLPSYSEDRANEVENFTPDREWMPRIVMIAKNAYVWLDQLRKRYEQPIHTLADIPDSELDALAHWGITGLWLIGLWERSPASKQIKQMMGNEDAVASAYSLYDYQIAGALGGEDAVNNLRERCWQRGVRLASDMVPNHVGIDGRWVVEHPDWFVSVGESPYPSYSFNGPNLSSDGRVGIYLEDHYYNRTDAAVVFRRTDFGSGDTRFIYHGNDGTSMAWNDTAQLNYLNPEVREAVIQTILHVARQFPVIRFDAAMTLAKKHYQRLWFPEPGTGGDIASRAEHAMTRAQFDQLMPEEFWREVVDRCAQEAPDTLLLAEAFWLMESYFVRTLGMHRVYNSAFMHLLRDEDNQKYRTLMKNTLEFDPEILKRYVNFMNNPDERTAVDQFGKGDKYFGICTLLTTMPGLPMFGHGQIEGFAEKYGMEYQRAYWDEVPDGYLIERHERDIFPLVHRRYLFANVEHFLLYDFFTSDGGVNEDVFAYSNRAGDERGLVVYHNKYADAAGWVRMSASYMARTGNGDERVLTQKILGEGLGLDAGDDVYYVFRDLSSGNEFLRAGRELVEKGMYIELGPYRCHVFLDWREVRDDHGQYSALAQELNGRGVPSVAEALNDLALRQVHWPLRALINGDMFRRLDKAFTADTAEPAPDDELAEAMDKLAVVDAGPAVADEPDEPAPPAEDPLLADIEMRMQALLRDAAAFGGLEGDQDAIVKTVKQRLAAILSIPAEANELAGNASYRATAVQLNDKIRDGDPSVLSSIWSWLFTHQLGALAGDDDRGQRSRELVDQWALGHVMASAMHELSLDQAMVDRAVLRAKLMVSQQDWYTQYPLDKPTDLVQAMFSDNELRQLLGVNRYQDRLWFSKEPFERLIWLMQFLAFVGLRSDDEAKAETAVATIGRIHETLQIVQEASLNSGYQVEKLLSLVHEAERAERTTL